MPEEAICLNIQKTHGERILASANKLGLIQKDLEILRNKDSLYIPLTRMPEEIELKQLMSEASEIKVEKQFFAEKKQGAKTVTEFLEDKLPPHILASLPHALDIVGDMAIIEIRTELEPYKVLVGEAILKTNKNVHTVLAKVGAVSGTYRLRKLDFIAGERKTMTLHKEYGCIYQVDITKTYFSPRLGHEHMRIAQLVQPEEIVIDLFAGVGPFAISIAKSHPSTKVYAIDINPEAVDLLRQNIRLNRVENRVYPITGDAIKIVDEELKYTADRVIMNLPETAHEFIDTACKALKPMGGIVHYYSFIRLPNTVENIKRQLSQAVDEQKRKVAAFTYTKNVRATAPFEWQVAIDMEIR